MKQLGFFDESNCLKKLSQLEDSTKKGNEIHYGYKDHVKVDADSKFITGNTVTPSSFHDNQEILKLVNETDKGRGSLTPLGSYYYIIIHNQ